MAYRRRKFVRRKRRFVRRKKGAGKRRFGRGRKRINDMRNAPLPLTLNNCMHYHNSYEYTNATAGFYIAQWRLNSLNDIDKTYAGVQPPLYDTLKNIYPLNMVKKCKFQMQIWNDLADSEMMVYFVVALNDDTTVLDPSTYVIPANPGYLGKMILAPTNTGQPNTRNTFGRTIDIRRWYKKLFLPYTMTPSTYNGFWATTNNNPASELYLNVIISKINHDTLAPLDTSFNAQFKQYTTWANISPAQLTANN